MPTFEKAYKKKWSSHTQIGQQSFHFSNTRLKQTKKQKNKTNLKENQCDNGYNN